MPPLQKKGYGRLAVTLQILAESSRRHEDFRADAPSLINSAHLLLFFASAAAAMTAATSAMTAAMAAAFTATEAVAATSAAFTTAFTATGASTSATFTAAEAMAATSATFTAAEAVAATTAFTAGAALTATLESMLDGSCRWSAATSAMPAWVAHARSASVANGSSAGHTMEAARAHGAAVKITVVDIDIPVDIYIYIMVAPTPRAPSPSPGRPNGYSSPEPEHPDSNGYPRENRVISEGGIRRPPPGPVDHCRIVTGNIDNFRIYRLNLDTLTFRNHLLLRGSFEIAGGISLLPQSLN